MPTVAESLVQAAQYLQGGHFSYAEQLLRLVLQAVPNHAEAWRRLGGAVQAQGRLDEAIHNYQQAIQVQPTYAEAYNDLGIALASRGRLDDAARTFQQALQRVPTNVDAANNLGVILGMLGRPQEAIASIQAALRVQPQNAGFLSNLGNVLRDAGRVDEAVASYRQSLTVNPNSAQTHHGLGNALREQGNVQDAIAHYRESLRQMPGYAKAHHGLGTALADLGQLEQAEDQFRQALRSNPQQTESHLLLGIILTRQGRFAEAVAVFHEALRLRPTYADAYNSLGNVLLEQGLHDDAQASFLKALELKPELAEARNNLANVLADQGKLDEALASYREALRQKPRYPDAHSNLLMHLNYHPDIDPDTVFAEHKRWDAVLGQTAKPGPHANNPDPDRRLRVGYVTPDLQRHPVHNFFVEPILAHQDARQVMTFCYAQVPRSLSPRVQALATCRSIHGLPDDAVARQVRDDAIDILVDLAGHTVNNRLGVFTYKPAPVQITGLGYPNTTGLAAMDYRLTDAIADPPGEPQRHTEELVRLPGAFSCYSPAPEAPPVTPLPALRNGCITFGSPHHLAKINGKVLDAWCAILRALPTARLLVFRHSLKGRLIDDMRQRFLQRGIHPQQLQLQTATDMAHGFLGWYGSVDIILDAFPWSSHTTACDSLWMGVPLLTLAGTTHVARMAASVLIPIGLGELVARTPQEYQEKALSWAGDVDRLAKLRSELRERLAASPLCDGSRYTQGLEAVYRQLWQRWCTRAR